KLTHQWMNIFLSRQRDLVLRGARALTLPLGAVVLREISAEEFDSPSGRLVRVVFGKHDHNVGEEQKSGEGIDERMRPVQHDASETSDEDGDEHHEFTPQREVGDLFDPREWAIGQTGEI